MNPSSEASGVRSSWLALAMKSTRSRSTRRISVRSRSVISAASTSPSGAASGATQTSNSALDRNALAPLHGLGLAAGHHPAVGVDDVGRAQGQHQRIAELEHGQKTRAPARWRRRRGRRRRRSAPPPASPRRAGPRTANGSGRRARSVPSVGHRRLRSFVGRGRHGLADRAPSPRRLHAAEQRHRADEGRDVIDAAKQEERGQQGVDVAADAPAGWSPRTRRGRPGEWLAMPSIAANE